MLLCGCGNGLFTTGGHFVVIVGIKGNTLEIYDPYLYNGKFDTSTRRGKVTVSKNTVYCSIENFRKYANYKCFFAFKNDENSESSGKDDSITKVESYTRYVKTSTKAGVNVRSGAGTNYSKVTAYSDGTKVTVYETKGNWSRIGKGLWICSDYLVETYNNNSTNSLFKSYDVKVMAKSGLNIRSGASTGYKKTGAYAYGKVVTIITQNGNWGKTTNGWICLDYTEKTSSSKASSSYTIKTVIAKSGLRVRKSASTNSQTITVYPYGTKVKVYGASNGWCKVGNGYMYAMYLK